MTHCKSIEEFLSRFPFLLIIPLVQQYKFSELLRGSPIFRTTADLVMEDLENKVIEIYPKSTRNNSKYQNNFKM